MSDQEQDLDKDQEQPPSKDELQQSAQDVWKLLKFFFSGNISLRAFGGWNYWLLVVSCFRAFGSPCRSSSFGGWTFLSLQAFDELLKSWNAQHFTYACSSPQLRRLVPPFLTSFTPGCP